MVFFQLETYHLTSSGTVLNAMIQCMFTDNYDASFCFWVFRFECNDPMHVHRQLWRIILLLGIREKVNTEELFYLL